MYSHHAWRHCFCITFMHTHQGLFQQVTINKTKSFNTSVWEAKGLPPSLCAHAIQCTCDPMVRQETLPMISPQEQDQSFHHTPFLMWYGRSTPLYKDIYYPSVGSALVNLLSHTTATDRSCSMLTIHTRDTSAWKTLLPCNIPLCVSTHLQGHFL